MSSEPLWVCRFLTGDAHNFMGFFACGSPRAIRYRHEGGPEGSQPFHLNAKVHAPFFLILAEKTQMTRAHPP